MNKFRPQALPKSLIFKQRLKHGSLENHNWQTRIRWYPAGWKVNQIGISRRFSHLHYLACHAPAPIQQRCAAAYKSFEQHHFAARGRASVRYLNTYTCHSWL